MNCFQAGVSHGIVGIIIKIALLFFSSLALQLVVTWNTLVGWSHKIYGEWHSGPWAEGGDSVCDKLIFLPLCTHVISFCIPVHTGSNKLSLVPESSFFSAPLSSVSIFSPGFWNTILGSLSEYGKLRVEDGILEGSFNFEIIWYIMEVQGYFRSWGFTWHTGLFLAALNFSQWDPGVLLTVVSTAHSALYDKSMCITQYQKAKQSDWKMDRGLK